MTAQTTGNDPPTKAAATTNSLSEVVVVTVPAIVAYYFGWAYLHFYLTAFGIDISELDIGIETIFIYSMPPIRLLAESYWYIVFGSLALVAVLWWSGVLHPIVAKMPLAQIRAHISHASWVVQGLYLFLLLMLFGFFSAPLIRQVAEEQAMKKWDHQGVQIHAIVKEPDAKLPEQENYRVCSERRALDLIFADRSRYYMLCRSEINSANAAVYEVGRDAGLASVRLIRKDH